MKPLIKSKVFWTMILAIAGALAGYFTGELNWKEAGATILTAVTGIFFRDAISTVGKQVVPLLLVLPFVGCGLLGTGASGATPEVGQATNTSNPSVSVIVYFMDRADAPDPTKPSITITPTVTYGEKALTAEMSTGGGGTAGTQGGSGGPLTPTINLPGGGASAGGTK